MTSTNFKAILIKKIAMSVALEIIQSTNICWALYLRQAIYIHLKLPKVLKIRYFMHLCFISQTWDQRGKFALGHKNSKLWRCDLNLRLTVSGGCAVFTTMLCLHRVYLIWIKLLTWLVVLWTADLCPQVMRTMRGSCKLLKRLLYRNISLLSWSSIHCGSAG